MFNITVCNTDAGRSTDSSEFSHNNFSYDKNQPGFATVKSWS